ncbi:MAG: PAS domain S-box protein [Phycisphaerales bacterium]
MKNDYVNLLQNGQEQIYRILVEHMYEAGIMTSPQGQVLYCNNRFNEMLNYPMESIIGKSIDDFVQKESRKNIWALIVGAQVKPMRKRIVFASSDGILVPARVSANIFSQDGTINICMVAADLTEIEASEEVIRQINEQREALRQSHQKYQHLVEGSNSVIVLSDSDLNIKFINEYGLKFFGYKKEELVGKNVLGTIIPQKDSQGLDITPMVFDLKDNPEKYITNIHQNIRKDGSYVWMSWANKPIYIDGELSEILAFGIDISKQKEIEENLKLTKQDLERSNKDLEQFAYIVSHDFREPLRAITGFIELLRQRYGSKLDGKGFEYIQSALEGSKRLNDLLTGLFQYSKVRINQNATLPVPAEAALKTAIANLNKAIVDSHTEITHDQMPDVRICGLQLVQLFSNLIGNAVKFRNSENPRIHVGCQKTGAYWQFSVQDNGIGIDKNDFDRIFMVFQRSHSDNIVPGYGIGLSICKKIVERSGGNIWVESEPGKGSTFYFTLPGSN